MRTSTRFASIAALAAAAATLAACGTAPVYSTTPVATYPSTYPATYPSTYPATSNVPMSMEYGRVTNIEYVTAGAPATTTRGINVTGAIVGGVAGAVLGNQVSRATGGGSRDAATVLGGVAGAALGSQVGRTTTTTPTVGAYPAYRVTVQTDSGAWRAYEVSATGDLRVGDRVRVENGVIYRA